MVRWPKLGLRGEFSTLGAFSDPSGHPITDQSATGCQYRNEVQIGSITATAPHWHTAQGLTIGDPLQRLLDLYPRAEQDGSTWWLHMIKAPYDLGGEIADMTATVIAGRVHSITLLIGAQGE